MSDEEEVLCFCNKPEGDEPMVCCDQCDQWCHLKCVDLTPAQAQRLKQFVCPRCSGPSQSDRRGREAHQRWRVRSNQVLVDFMKLEMRSLIKYKHHFGLEGRPDSSKEEAIADVKKHFTTHPRLYDAEVIADFLKANNDYKKKFITRARRPGR